MLTTISSLVLLRFQMSIYIGLKWEYYYDSKCRPKFYLSLVIINNIIYKILHGSTRIVDVTRFIVEVLI